MRLVKKAGRRVVVLLLSLLILQTIGPAQAFGQSQQPSSSANSTDIEAIINNAESLYRQGEEAQTRGQLADARKFFDQALDAILMSGVNTRANSRFDAYYRDLIARIHKHEALPTDDHSEDQRAEVAEPSVLDELSNINDSELTTATPDGVTIFGKYDFDFSVAPPVFQFINFFVAGRGHSTMEAGLQRSGRYRQMVEKIFKEERVPLDLIWLAQAESVWKPNALSHAAAKGIWQFIPSTGLRYGLSQSEWVDERSHPEKSTRAAARYLRWLHDYFAGDWLLAMAAYNSGENRVASAVARCGYADFWEIHRRGLLPQETRNYVPIILSIIIISKNQKRYGFDVSPDQPQNFDTFQLPAQTDLKVVADLLGVPYEVVQDLNPELRRGASPAGQPYSIKIPKGMKKQFEIAYASLPEDQRVRKIAVPSDDIAESYRPAYRTQLASYTIRRGDTLAGLARKHGVSVQEIARLNRMSARGQLRKGQTIRIPKTIRASRASASRSSVSRSRGHANRYSEKKVSRSRLAAREKSSRAKSSSGKNGRGKRGRASSSSRRRR